MASSYRDDLNRGGMREWQEKLEKAIALVQEVRDAIWECIGSDGQFDNAADDGALSEKLGLAIRFIREELPSKAATSTADRG